MADEQEQTKSARRRAAKKARDAAHAEEAAAAAAAEAAAAAAAAAAEAAKAKAKAKGKAAAKATAAAAYPAEAQAKAKGKAKAEPKAAAAPQPEAKATAKASAKSKAAASAPAAAPKAPEPAPAPKATAKATGKAKAKAAPAPEEPKKRENDIAPLVQYDDGTGGEWEEVAVPTKKEKKKAPPAPEAPKAAQAVPAATTAGYPKENGKGGKGNGKGDGTSAAAQAALEKAHAAVAASVAEATAAAAAAAAAKAGTAVPIAPLHSASVQVPEAKIGAVIGPRGKNIKTIQDTLGVKIDTLGGTWTITGPEKEGVLKAEVAVKELKEKGYMSMSFEDFKEDSVMVSSSSVSDIIGTKGAVISKIKEDLGVVVEIPEGARKQAGAFGEKDLPQRETKVKITLAGERDKVERAKEAIANIVQYYCDPLTHPDQVHEELDIDPDAYRYIIGRAGSEMRHIQKSYRVKVYIPRENTVNKHVVVVGEKNDVTRAVKYINDHCMGMKEETEKREANGDSKPKWSEEKDGDGEEEAWMKRHMASSSIIGKR